MDPPIVETIDPTAKKVEEQMVVEVKETPQPPKKRHPLLHCPVCGMLCDRRRYQLEHPFPNAMERIYGGRSKISVEYMDEDDELAIEMNEVAQDQIVNVALSCLGEQHREILRNTLNDEVL